MHALWFSDNNVACHNNPFWNKYTILALLSTMLILTLAQVTQGGLTLPLPQQYYNDTGTVSLSHS